jgi:DNA-binding MarR family transcriptional regulator
MSNPTKLTGYHLWLSTQYRQKSLNRILKEFNLTHAQYIIMQYLSRADLKKKLSWLSQNKIAKELDLDPMMISNVLRLLEKKWYIVRKKSTSWVVSNSLWLSKIGHDLITKAHNVVLKLEEKMFDDDSAKKLKKCFKKIVESAQ